jgi:hypothetical protein
MPRNVHLPNSLVTFHSCLELRRMDRGVTMVARATCIRRAATPSPPSLEDCSSGGHILFLLLKVIFLVHTIYLWRTFSPPGTLFLSLFVIYVFAVFAHIHCAHSQSRSAHLVFLGGASQGVSWGAYSESPFYFLSLSLYVEGIRHSQLLSAKFTRMQFWLHHYIYS